MKTTTLIVASIFLALQITLEAQNDQVRKTGADHTVITVPHDNYISQLLREASALTEKADQLRADAKNVNDERKKKMLTEASALEIQSIEKQIEAHEINYALNARLFSDNNKTIKQLQKKSGSKKSGQHLQYLVKEYSKNMKLANELAEESNFQDNPALRLGSLDNAEEKMLLALKQQRESIEILTNDTKIASTK